MPDDMTPEQRRAARQRRRQIESEGHDGPLMQVPPDAATADDHRNPRRRRNENRQPRVNGDGETEAPEYGEVPEVGVLVRPDPDRDNLDALVLADDCRADIRQGLRSIQLRAEMERVWNISRIQPQDGRCVLNFYGPPGTGKTRAALAIAHLLGKRMYQVDYSAVISKYLGDTAKHIVYAFKRARELDSVLFFDEADSLLSKRVNMNESCATSINQNRNTLMQELDRFNGVVILTTNLFGNYDPALLRRIARHVRFQLPDRTMRHKLFELHLPNMARVRADLDTVALESKGLSGGDILNVCVNAIYAGSASDNPEQWEVTGTHLLAEIEKVKRSKREHQGASNPSAN